MDFNIFGEYVVAIVLLACLMIGYAIKHASFFQWINNSDIPIILAVVGAIINPLVSGFSVQAVIYGAFTGLCSTGLHQAFKQFIERNNE